jgi:hypothetical protein
VSADAAALTHAPSGEPYPGCLVQPRFRFEAARRARRTLSWDVVEPGDIPQTRIRARHTLAEATVGWLAALVCVAAGTLAGWLALSSGFSVGALVTAAVLFLLMLVVGLAMRLVLTPPPAVEVLDGPGGVVLATARRDSPLLAPARRYLVTDTRGRKLARIECNGLTHWTRERWDVFPVTDDLEVRYLAVERPAVLAWARGLSLGLLSGRIRTDLVFSTPGQNLEWGRFHKRETAFMRPYLELAADREGRLDRRVALCVAAMFYSTR